MPVGTLCDTSKIHERGMRRDMDHFEEFFNFTTPSRPGVVVKEDDTHFLSTLLHMPDGEENINNAAIQPFPGIAGESNSDLDLTPLPNSHIDTLQEVLEENYDPIPLVETSPSEYLPHLFNQTCQQSDFDSSESIVPVETKPCLV